MEGVWIRSGWQAGLIALPSPKPLLSLFLRATGLRPITTSWRCIIRELNLFDGDLLHVFSVQRVPPRRGGSWCLFLSRLGNA